MAKRIAYATLAALSYPERFRLFAITPFCVEDAKDGDYRNFVLDGEKSPEGIIAKRKAYNPFKWFQYALTLPVLLLLSLPTIGDKEGTRKSTGYIYLALYVLSHVYLAILDLIFSPINSLIKLIKFMYQREPIPLAVTGVILLGVAALAVFSPEQFLDLGMLFTSSPEVAIPLGIILLTTLILSALVSYAEAVFISTYEQEKTQIRRRDVEEIVKENKAENTPLASLASAVLLQEPVLKSDRERTVVHFHTPFDATSVILPLDASERSNTYVLYKMIGKDPAQEQKSGSEADQPEVPTSAATV